MATPKHDQVDVHLIRHRENGVGGPEGRQEMFFYLQAAGAQGTGRLVQVRLETLVVLLEGLGIQGAAAPEGHCDILQTPAALRDDGHDVQGGTEVVGERGGALDGDQGVRGAAGGDQQAAIQGALSHLLILRSLFSESSKRGRSGLTIDG